MDPKLVQDAVEWFIKWSPWALIGGFLLKREWLIVSVRLRHVVDLHRDGDRFNKSIRDHELSQGDRAVAVTLFYVGPRPLTIVDVGFRMFKRARWPRSQASHRTLENFYVERWLIPMPEGSLNTSLRSS